MRKRKIIISFFVTVLTVSLISGLVFADDGDDITIEDVDLQDVDAATMVDWGWCGDDCTWVLMDDGELRIQGKYGMYDYTADYPAPWYDQYGDSITRVTVSDEISTIGNYAFYGLTNLETVEINPVGVLCKIGKSSFRNCSSLEEFSIPMKVYEIKEDAFYGCSSLEDLYCFPDPESLSWEDSGSDDLIEDNGTVIHVIAGDLSCYEDVFSYINGEFTGDINDDPCGYSVSWSYDEDTETLYINGTGDMFDYYDASDVPWYDLHYYILNVEIEEGVTSVGDLAFISCTYLKDVSLPEGIEKIGVYSFSSCSSLVSVDIPDSVKLIDEVAFAHDNNLIYVNFGEGSKLETIELGAFYDCYWLRFITIPQSVTCIEEDAFEKCSGMCDIFCYADPAELVWTDNCADFSNVICHVPSEQLDAFNSTFSKNGITFQGDLLDRDLGEDVSWDFDADSGVLTISGNGDIPDRDWGRYPCIYQYAGSIESIIIEEGITGIGEYSLSMLPNLSGVTIADSVTFIGNRAFYDCQDLSEVLFSFDSQLESIGNMSFMMCYSLHEFTIPKNVTTVGGEVFYLTGSLDDIYCYAYIGDMTWDYNSGLKDNRGTNLHVLCGCENDFYYVYNKLYVTVVGDLGMVIINESENGTVESPSPVTFVGDRIYLTITPDEGYETGEIIITDAGGNIVEFNEEEQSFIYPQSQNVTIDVSFVRPVSPGWLNEDSDWFYISEDGEYATGWKKISGKYYYFSEEGVMQKGWLKDGNKWYYLNSGGSMATGWKQIKNKWYYFKGSGEMVTDWKKVSGKYYYFNTSGAMQTGWLKDGSKYYYLGTDGAMVTGWKQVSGKWYYFNAGGDMVTGWKKIDSKWYYFQTSGAMQTANLTYKGKVYYFNSDGSCKNP